MSCQQEVVKSDCHFSNMESPLEIKFTEGIAHSFYFSPFEKQKIFIGIKDSKISHLEYNFVDKTFTPLNRDNWKVRVPSNAPFYVDNSSNTIWIGGKKELRKIKTDSVTTLPIKNVTRIIPYYSYIYFVADHGFYKWDKKNNSYEKLKIPFRNFPPTYLLDEETLIFGNKLTYNLKENTWKEGVHIYNFEYKEKSNDFKIEKGVGIFPYGNHNVKLILPNESRKVGLGNRPKHLNIQLPFIWKNSKNAIIRYDIEKDQLDTFRFTLPLASDRNTKFKFINKKEQTWIFQKNNLFFINVITGKMYNYKFNIDKNCISLRVDDCNVYLLFEDKLIVKNKDELIQDSLIYDDQEYATQLNEFRKFRNATNISKEKNEDEVFKKLEIIKSRYDSFDHPDIQKELRGLNISAFNSVQYETVSQLEACLRNNKIPLEKRKRCYQTLIRKEVINANFKNAISLEKEFFSNINREGFSQDYNYYTSLDSIKKYLSTVDSLDKSDIAEDSLNYKKAQALNSICRTSYFCHEGCGGCDFGLVIIALNDFIKNYPNSDLRDNAKYDLLGYYHMYIELNGDFSDFIKDFDNFIDENPDSDLIENAHFKIIITMFNFQENQKIKTVLLKRIIQFEKDYPESKYQKLIKEQLKWLN